MSSILTGQAGGNNRFHIVADPFCQRDGLPFAEVLPAEIIEQAFADNDALFGEAVDEIFSTQVVLWGFLEQGLQDGKGAACAAAIAAIATHMHQTGGRVPCGDTGDYCRARAKLNLSSLWMLVRLTANQMERKAPDPWLFGGLHAKLVDGFTFTMPDTPANQAAFPQSSAQKPGLGFPIARAVGVLSLATAAIHAVAIGPYAGKQTGEPALLRTLLGHFGEGDVAVFDRCFCSYWTFAALMQRRAHVCARLHQNRAKAVGKHDDSHPYDRPVTWTRPARPQWMSPSDYEKIPGQLRLRELQFDVHAPGRRTGTITVITTLTDPTVYPAGDIAALYGYRWNVELDIRQIKQTLGLDHVRCLSPHMIRRELAVTLLAYNLIRKVIATAAAVHGKRPRRLGFTLACQEILSSWMLISTGDCRDARGLWRGMLRRIAAHEVANRPGRIEPRKLKQRKHRFPLMTRPRTQLREELQRT
jgi:putative transposase